MRSFAAIILLKPLGFLGVSLANPLAWFGACIPLIGAYYIIIKKIESEYLIKSDYSYETNINTCAHINE